MRILASLALVASILLFASAGPPGVRGAPTTEPTTGPTDKQLHLAGFDNADEVREFLQRLQQAEAKGDREAIVTFVRFPFTRYSQVKKRYKSKAELLTDFDKVFTAKVLDAIRAGRFETLFLNYQGAMIGDGEVWFDKRAGKIAIKTVNP
jgi:hypothetical protein